MENERCTYKINELKQRLSEQNTNEGHNNGMSPKIYAKSFKVASD